MSGKPHDPQRWQKRFDNADLTRRILDRTSGRACDRAEQLLGGRWDDGLQGVDEQLLHGHLDGCADCRVLATILERLQPALPGLAEREPGPAFTARVLARTSAAQPVSGASAPGRAVRLLGRLENALRGAWRRPRFALEAAWTAATLTALLVWSPLAPGVADDQVTVAVRAGTSAVPELVQQIERLGDSALLAGREIFGPHADRIEKEAGEIKADLGGHFQTVKQAGKALWQRLTGDDPQPESE